MVDKNSAMTKKARPTMKDVAAWAGVSQTTVSFVLNDAPPAANISLETKQKIEDAVQALGYRPNPTAQLLRTNRSQVLGLITDKIATAPFAGDTIRGAQTAAWSSGNMLMLINTDGQPDREQKAVDLLLDRQVDGIIYASMYTREVQTLPTGLQDIPSILVDCFDAAASNYVIPDESYGAKLATEHLIKKGHARIAFINGEAGYYASTLRFESYKTCLLEAGLPFDDTLVQRGNWWPNSGYAHTLTLMRAKNPPTAIFCGNDRMALGALQALAKLGLEVPADVAVVGYDGELVTKRVVPPLTTVKLPHYEMGKAAVEYITNAERPDSFKKMIQGRLIERQSS